MARETISRCARQIWSSITSARRLDRILYTCNSSPKRDTTAFRQTETSLVSDRFQRKYAVCSPSSRGYKAFVVDPIVQLQIQWVKVPLDVHPMPQTETRNIPASPSTRKQFLEVAFCFASGVDLLVTMWMRQHTHAQVIVVLAFHPVLRRESGIVEGRPGPP
jgi:hypothetical protein